MPRPMPAAAAALLVTALAAPAPAIPGTSAGGAGKTEPQPDRAVAQRARSRKRIGITCQRNEAARFGSSQTTVSEDGHSNYFIPVMEDTIARGSRSGQRPAST